MYQESEPRYLADFIYIIRIREINIGWGKEKMSRKFTKIKDKAVRFFYIFSIFEVIKSYLEVLWQYMSKLVEDGSAICPNYWILRQK